MEIKNNGVDLPKIINRPKPKQKLKKIIEKLIGKTNTIQILPVESTLSCNG